MIGRLRAGAVIAACLALAACQLQTYGVSGAYTWDNPEPVAVDMPAGALSIRQQFRPDVDGGLGAHNGFDVWGPVGTPVLAVAPGRVIQSFYEPAYGNQIVVDHGPDEKGRRVHSVYVHLRDRMAEVGDAVARGEQIATMGATGALGMAVHLHFELRRGSAASPVPSALDPHLLWVDGPGKVTCYDPGRRYPAKPFGITYPTPCKDS